MKRTYRVIVVQGEDGSYSGRCIEYPGAISQGETLAELKENMKDAINLVQKSYDRDYKDSPRTSNEKQPPH
jgi:predicted RNase H-like HicB family nuclease